MGYLKTKHLFCFALRRATCLEQILPYLGSWMCSDAVMHTFYHENGRQAVPLLAFFAKLLYCIFRDDCTMVSHELWFQVNKTVIH